MSPRAVALTLVAALAVAACDNKTDANAKNFGAALSTLFAKNDLCLPDTAWPVYINKTELQSSNILPISSAGQVIALEAAGLVKSSDAEIDQLDAFGKPTGAKRQVKRYELTDAAKPFYQDRPNSVYAEPSLPKPAAEGRLCWGKKVLDKVVKWEGPIKFGDYQEALVVYTYQIQQMAPWARKPEIQTAFYEVKNVIDGAGTFERKHKVKLTSEGWEAPAGIGD